jgi:hypothetical protein
VLDSATAEIIQFPVRPNVPDLLAPSHTEHTEAEERLNRALASLNSALTAQRAAVGVWKSSISDLSTATGRLGASLRSYHDSLGQLDVRVSTLRAESLKLEARAGDDFTR